jgi:hypothetical protein
VNYSCVEAIPDVPQGRCTTGFSETQGLILTLGPLPSGADISGAVLVGFVLGFAPVRAISLVIREVVRLVQG